MKLSLSGFAINEENEIETYKLLNKYGITHIEGVLSKISSGGSIDENVITDYKNKLNDYGLVCESLQSIFIGSNITSLNERDKARDHIERVIDFAKILGVKILVLGSASLRKDYNFRVIADLLWDIKFSLQNTDITLCIEPTASYYKSEYWHSTDEIIEFLNKLRLRKNFGTMIDFHNIRTETGDYNNINIQLNNNIDWIDHVHISDIHLGSIEYVERHKEFAGTLYKNNYNGIVTYEVNDRKNLEPLLEAFSNFYLHSFQKENFQR